MDIICSGIIVVDHRRAAAHSPEGLPGPPLRIVENALELKIGGIPILAAACKQMGLTVSLMGCVGRDIAGYGLKAYLEKEAGINVEAVNFVDAPTSNSFIRLTENQRYIEHTPGASALWLPGKPDLSFVSRNKPALMAIGYAGLLPKLDAGGGMEMTRWITRVQSTGALVALDTHTAPPYAMLEKPVSAADIFICDQEEACGIACSSDALPEKLLAAIWERYPPRDPDRPRLMGLTLPEGAQLAYGQGAGFTNQWVANPYHGRFASVDLTGAGDCFRAGVYSYVLYHLSEFSSGLLDLETTGRCGHFTAGRCLEKGCENLPAFGEIEKLCCKENPQ